MLAPRLAFVTILAIATVSANPILGQSDTFSTTSTLNWTNGAPATDPLVISTGGPAGAGDGYLQVTANNSGSAGKLTIFNRSQWAGDFSAAGIFSIEMDLANFGASALSLRVALKSGTFSNSPGFLSTTAFALSADGQWHRHHPRFPAFECGGDADHQCAHHGKSQRGERNGADRGR